MKLDYGGYQKRFGIVHVDYETAPTPGSRAIVQA